MRRDQQLVQWTLTVTISHGLDHWHYVDMATETIGRGGTETPLGSWKGLGAPEGVISGIEALVTAAIEEHIVTRYGIQDPLALRWDHGPASA